MIKEFVKKILNRFIFDDNSPHKLALAFSVGIYIAFSPFIGFHNIMILVFSLIFKLNAPLVFIAAHINNPLTAIPIFSFNYFFGYWFLKDLCGIGVINPECINYINNCLTFYIGLPKLCFWSFMLGSTILGIFFAIISYPLMKFIFTKINYKDLNFNNLKQLIKLKNENYCTK